MNLDQLVSGINDLHEFSLAQVTKQVNKWLTIRNWLVGFYLVEYELSGEDRADYGEKIIPAVAKSLKHAGLKGFGTSNLASFIQLYHTYPQIFQTASGKLDGLNTVIEEVSSSIGSLSWRSKMSQFLANLCIIVLTCSSMNLDQLVSGITELQGFTQSQATKQVNQWLTLRNWLIGAYIVEYENGGEDRAEYGAKVIDTLSSRLKIQGLKGMGSTNLRHFTTFYALYPHIRQSLTGILGQSTIPDHIRQSVTGISLGTTQEPLDSSSESISPISADQLLQNCSFTHFVEFIRIDDPLKRSFYEYQVVNQSWSVRQLKRATESMLYERTGLSTDKSGVVASFDAGKALTAAEIVRDPYFLEFLNLPEKAAYTESDLEQAIIDNLQDFLLEMGEGFCFEARQRRITFGNTHYRIDLVFYHRLLRCHILIDLKIGAFTHADTGQMNVYLNYYKDNVQTTHDNPPIGIILCADKDDSLVHYATGGLDQQLFVSQYQVKLPSESTLKQLLSNSISTLE